jgi:DNA repair exonuclease SbcCD nuclease subunit
MFKFLHAADIHLDSPLRGLERYEGAPVDRIRHATRRALENLVQLALDERVAFVLIAGDLYDGTWRDYNTGLFLCRQMFRLREADIPVFLIAGNHDAENKMTRTLRLPDNVTLFTSVQPQTVELDIGVAIHGQSFAKAKEERNLAAQYPYAARGLFNVGLLHTCAGGRHGHEAYAPCSSEDLRSREYDYWALGHVHKREVFPENRTIIFPGNLQGRDIGETGAKGCMLVTVRDDGTATPEFQSLDVLRWERCEVSAFGAANGDEVMERVSEQLETNRAASEGRPLAVRVEIHASCAAHNQLQVDPHKWINEIRRTANEIGGDQIWVEKVNLRTTPCPADDSSGGDGAVAELQGVLDELQTDEGQLFQLAAELEELGKKLPADIKAGPDALDFKSPAWLRNVLYRVGPMLVERLRPREATR